jgi:hypothetical protein
VTATVDHVFVLCSVGAEPEAEALRRLGVREGSPNTHPGQGTSCRRFFFSDVYLELAWVHDAAEAKSEAVRPTRLFERWRGRDGSACPFGIILRPAEGANPAAPFPTWAYRPSYMPAGFSIDIAKDTPLQSPEFFYLGFQRDRARRGQEPTDHGIPVGPLRKVSVWRPAAGRCEAAQALEAAGLVAFHDADHYFLEMTFGEGAIGQADLGPALPVGLRW